MTDICGGLTTIEGSRVLRQPLLRQMAEKGLFCGLVLSRSFSGPFALLDQAHRFR